KVDIGTSAKALKLEDRQLLQAMADEFDAQLISDIRRMRPSLTGDDKTLDGRIITASQAKEHGLIDQIGDMDAAIGLAASLGCRKGPAGRPQVVLYRRSNDPAN